MENSRVSENGKCVLREEALFSGREVQQLTENPVIIDFHVHPFGEAAYNLNLYPGTYDLNLKGMKEQLAKAGITRICGSVLMREPLEEGFQSLRALNREALRLRRELGDFYVPGFHVHPAYVRESCEEIAFMHGEGVRLIGELVPYMHGWGSFSEKNWAEILDVAEQYGMVCSYHTPFDYDMKGMIDSHPGMTFVAAHPGDRQRVAEQIELLKSCSNLCLDLSGTGLHRFGMLKRLVEQAGADRILFGTDYPICNPRMYVQAVYGEEIGNEERKMIFHENAERILGI